VQGIQEHPLLFVIGAVITAGSVTASVMGYFHSERIEATNYKHQREIDALEEKYIEALADSENGSAELCQMEEKIDLANDDKREVLKESRKTIAENPEQSKLQRKERIANKLSIKSVYASSYFSSLYSESKLFDGDSKTYWSTKKDMVSNVSLEIALERESDIETLKVFAPSYGPRYAQPKLVSLQFLGTGGIQLQEEEFSLTGANSMWRVENSEPIKKVASILVNVKALFNDSAAFLTINEIEVYGADSAK